MAAWEGQHRVPAERGGTQGHPCGGSTGGGTRRALRLLGAAEAFCETLGLRSPVGDPHEYTQTVTAGRAAHGEAAFAAAWAEGRSMSLEQAVEYALEPGEG